MQAQGNRVIIFWLSALTVALIIIAALAAGTEDGLKIGYVDSGRLIAEFAPAQAVHAEISQMQKLAQERLSPLSLRLDSLQQAYQAAATAKAESVLPQLGEELTAQNRQFQAAAQEFNRQISQHELQKMQPIYAEINGILAEFGQQYGYEMIWAATTSGNIVYAKESVNLTEEVVTFMKGRQAAEVDSSAGEATER